MGLFDRIIRSAKRSAEKSFERKAEQEITGAINRQLNKNTPPQEYRQAGGGSAAGQDAERYRISAAFAPPRVSYGRELSVFAPNIREESRLIALQCFDLAQRTTIDGERRENYNMAAAHGHIGAMYMQGMIYYGDCMNYARKDGLAECFREMVCSFEDAALYGHLPSIEMLGYIYAGTGDIFHAKNWLEKAESMGSGYARNLLGQLA